MLKRFGLPADSPLGQLGASATTILERLSNRLETSRSELAQALTSASPEAKRSLLQDHFHESHSRGVIAQHVGYVSGQVSEEFPLPMEGVRQAISAYFDRGAGPSGHPELVDALANLLPGAQRASQLRESELAHLSSMRDEISHFVNEHSNYFDPDINDPSFILSNLSAVYAGEAVLSFAGELERLSGNDASLSVFSIPQTFLVSLAQHPKGREGMLVSFAAMAHHLSWEFTKLMLAREAIQADPTSTNAAELWNAKEIAPTEDRSASYESARKWMVQFESFLVQRGLRSAAGSGSLHEIDQWFLRDEVRQRGHFQDARLWLLSPFAETLSDQLSEQVLRAGTTGDAEQALSRAAEDVSQIMAAFATRAMAGPEASPTDLIALDWKLERYFKKTLKEKFLPELKRLLDNGQYDVSDPAFKALYQKKAGAIVYEALQDFYPAAYADSLVADSGLTDLIALSGRSLHHAPAGYTPERLLKDLEWLTRQATGDDAGGLLRNDSYLIDLLPAMKQVKSSRLKESDLPALDLADRFANLVWVGTVLVRGLAPDKLHEESAQAPQTFPQNLVRVEEERLVRAHGGEPNKEKDAFPDNVQFHAPEIRDFHLFTWACKRLELQGVETERAEELAFAVVVATLYKDLHQLKNVAGALAVDYQ
jgi:hypothetical protein